MQEKIIEEIHSVIITLLDNKDQTVKFDRIVKLCQLINNLKKMFPKKMLKEYLEFIDSMEIFLENCSNENFLNENQEILLSSLELLSECINEIKKYFNNSSIFDNGNNRNSVDHGYMHPRFWEKESFEALIHDIARISKFSGF